MSRVIKETVTVKPGGVIEIRRMEIPAGTSAEVTVTVEEPVSAPRRRLASFIGRGRGCFNTADEVDQFIRSERDKWDSAQVIMVASNIVGATDVR